jgi:hypothetical protein
MTPEEKTEVRREVLGEIIAGYDQLIGLFQTGGQAPLTGHAYDPKEKAREIELLKQLRLGMVEMRDG